MPRQDFIKFRRDSSDGWATSTEALALGEPGYDYTNKVVKVGTGVDLWADLDALGGGDPVDLSTVMGVVESGADANAARPAGYTVVTWIGSVYPVNALPGDVWLYKA